jgi:hypothetical protein
LYSPSGYPTSCTFRKRVDLGLLEDIQLPMLDVSAWTLQHSSFCYKETQKIEAHLAAEEGGSPLW